MFSEPPASKSNTLTDGFSDKRAAKTAPAEPAPTDHHHVRKLREIRRVLSEGKSIRIKKSILNQYLYNLPMM